MKVASAIVVSADGKLTRHNERDIYQWVSEEDQTEFFALMAKHQAVVMGSGTYKQIRDSLQLTSKRLRVVLTSKPEQFLGDSVPGKLEFMDVSAPELVTHLESQGKDSLLIVGGPGMMSEFLEASLIDELFVTVEPRIFGSGLSSFTTPTDVQLKLLSTKQLNAQGTLLLHYKVLN